MLIKRPCIKITAAVIFVLLTLSVVNAEFITVFDKNFFRSFSAKTPIQRDVMLEGLVSHMLIGRGTIATVLERENYKKKFRIEIHSSESQDYSIKMIYYVYLENRNTIELLTENSTFEFKGQMVDFTPLNSKRNEYIIDIILMEGSTIIE